MELKPFKMKPHAMNAAKKLGLGPEAVQKNDDGLWIVVVPAAEPENTAPVAPIATGGTFPDRRAPVPQNPVAFIRHILNSVQFPSRKEAVSFFVTRGINEATAKTQYQKWRSGR